MKKLLCIATLSACTLIVPAVQPTAVKPNSVTSSISFKKYIETILVHNLGNQSFTLNSVSVLFSINNANPQKYTLKYKKIIKAGKIGKINNAKIQFNNYPIDTQISYSGLAEININNNQVITIQPENRFEDIYVGNKNGTWIETAQSKAVTPKAKAVTAKIAPDEKNTPKAAQTSSLKSAAVVMNKKTKAMLPQSKTAKAIKASMPKQAVIAPEISKE